MANPTALASWLSSIPTYSQASNIVDTVNTALASINTNIVSQINQVLYPTIPVAAVNLLGVTVGAAGTGVTLTVDGSSADTNAAITLRGRGTGNTNLGSATSLTNIVGFGTVNGGAGGRAALEVGNVTYGGIGIEGNNGINGYSGSTLFLDYTLVAGARFQSSGADTLTNGVYSVLSVRSNGTNAITVWSSDTSGNITLAQSTTSPRFIPTSATIPTNGLYLPAANIPGIAANSLPVIQFAAQAGADTYFNLQSATSGQDVILGVAGVQTNMSVQWRTLGTGVHKFMTNGTTQQVEIEHVAGANRFLKLSGANAGNPTIDVSGGSLAIMPALVCAAGITLIGGAQFLTTSSALTDYTAAQTATLTNGPVAGNPTKWIAINDNGTLRKIPAW